MHWVKNRQVYLSTMSKFTGQDYCTSEVILRAGKVQNNIWVNRIRGQRVQTGDSEDRQQVREAEQTLRTEQDAGMVRSYPHVRAHTKSPPIAWSSVGSQVWLTLSLLMDIWWGLDLCFLDRISTHLYTSTVAIHSDKLRVYPFYSQEEVIVIHQ